MQKRKRTRKLVKRDAALKGPVNVIRAKDEDAKAIEETDASKVSPDFRLTCTEEFFYILKTSTRASIRIPQARRRFFFNPSDIAHRK